MKEIIEVLGRTLIVIFCLFSTFTLVDMNNINITNNFTFTKIIPIFLLIWVLLPAYDFIRRTKIMIKKEKEKEVIGK